MIRDDIELFTGDAAGARILRDSLRELASERVGTPLGERIEQVLAGRLGMRQLAEDPELVQFAHDGMAAFDELWQSLSPAEREEALEAGRAHEHEPDPPRR